VRWLAGELVPFCTRACKRMVDLVFTIKSQLQATPVYKPLAPKFGGQYMGKVLVPVDKLHQYFADVVRSVIGTSRIVICQTLLL